MYIVALNLLLLSLLPILLAVIFSHTNRIQSHVRFFFFRAVFIHDDDDVVTLLLAYVSNSIRKYLSPNLLNVMFTN